MLGHTKKHHTNKDAFSKEKKSQKSDAPINWKEAAKEVFGDIPNNALNLRGLRNREGLTQAQLGQVIGIEQANISKMELGKRQIGVKIAKKLEKHFNIDYRLFL